LDPNDQRILLTSALEKTPLLWHNGGRIQPHGSTPTIHIFKLRLSLVSYYKGA
jgi:hypothetical protein